MDFFDRVETVLRDLAVQAGAAIMEVYARDDLGTRAKADASPVTEADLAADAIISAGLAAAFPAIAVVTEEQVSTHTSTATRFFIVDPLDGTKEFVQRRGDFTVNIALVDNGVPVRGVVFAPAKGRMFFTRADGVSVEDIAGRQHRLHVSHPDNAALVVVASKSHRDAATDKYLEKYAISDLAAAGSSLKFCLVAAGEADFYPRLGRTMEWDTAAGHAILAGAGGQVLDFDTHEPLRYGKPGFGNPFFLAFAPGVELFRQ